MNVASLLISKGADVNVKNKQVSNTANFQNEFEILWQNKGKTPLHWAAYAARSDTVQLLLDKVGNRAFILSSFPEHIFTYSITKGADVNSGFMSGSTPLHEVSHDFIVDTQY